MKLIAVIKKCMKEQLRSYWVLLLTLAMGPFFIFVYYLIVESSKPHYDLIIVSYDKGVQHEGVYINYSDTLISRFSASLNDSLPFPLSVTRAANRQTAMDALSNKKGNALIVLSENFSKEVRGRKNNQGASGMNVEITGDLTDSKYLITAVWANELLNDFAFSVTNNNKLVQVTEIPLGSSASVNDFDMIVPGILVVSMIMLMFTASISFVSEVENKTILRLRLSNVSSLTLLGGISIVQSLVGIASVILTLITAIFLGFHYEGSVLLLLIISIFTCLSIIAFSVIIAAISKTANEVLIIGNFPMFLFMFFTGAAFPMKSEPWFTLAGYPVSSQGIMTPVHAISALNKTLIMNMHFADILPEIAAICILTVFYFVIGVVCFRFRHLQLHY